MQPDVAVEVDGLTKVFRDPVLGEHRAVDGVSFACRYGRVFGLLGPNGAGKTTTLRMVATVLSPTAGTARVAGHDVAADPDAARARIGFLTASTGVYERLTPREILAFFGRLHRMDEERLATRTDELLDLFELRAHADRLCGTLSTGTRQKVNVARSVVHDPPVLIFDEPTAGLDCVVARTVTDFLRLARERGRAILLSGHRMEEVERLCDDAAILFDGKIRTEGSLDELRATWAEPTLEGIFFAAIAREKAGATHGP